MAYVQVEADDVSTLFVPLIQQLLTAAIYSNV